MSTEQFCVSWVSYRDCISKGFSRLQQNGEFVDMTLAAEGYLVKVHQNIVALASPYLKAMIQSVSCQHPIIFLNNIGYETLGFILEYIYTGEVNVQTNLIPVFIEACKALCINGVENLVLPMVFVLLFEGRKGSSIFKLIPLNMPQKEAAEAPPQQLVPTIERTVEQQVNNNFAAHITINSDNIASYNVEVLPINNTQYPTPEENLPIISLDDAEINYNSQLCAVVDNESNNGQRNTVPIIPLDDEVTGFVPVSCSVVEEETQSKTLINSYPYTTDQNKQNLVCNLSTKEIQPTKHKRVRTLPPSLRDKDRVQLYSISNRGSLLLLLNSYMYYCHHHSCGGRKRRWRCVDYRKLHCPAFIDTDDDNILNRSETHSHSNHDAKILRKFKSKSVYTSLSQAEEKVTSIKEPKELKVSIYKKRPLREQRPFYHGPKGHPI